MLTGLFSGGVAAGASSGPARLLTGSRAETAAPPNVLSASTQVAHTPDGAVGYREIGAGSPLLLIMGYAGSMDNWPPDFIDELAESHLVVMFDNAGVGKTSRLPGMLTIDAMADQTSVLLTALHLRRVAVLGWSMGGMTAQALAVLHPSQVSALVLAATQLGNGKALPVPAAAAAELASPDPRVLLSALFPRGQAAAARAYALGILQYPNFYTAPPGVLLAQSNAVTQWIEGKDAAGRAASEIRVPTLVADGAVDALDPSRNAALLTAAIKGARAHLYPDAGHAFLFQDYTEFISALNSFLGQVG
ncbi:MAG TPA: alpha/beta hydrolase [Acidimicrobiales bacterium]|nr:alpha/beta hydrolase [Acidimicrobiales bacterium]